MQKRLLVFCILFFLSSVQVSLAQQTGLRIAASGEPIPTLYELLDSQWVYLMHEYPEWATDMGFPGQNGRWTDMSTAAIEHRQYDAEEFMKALRLGNRAQFLDDSARFDQEVALRGIRDQIESFAFHEDLLPISQLSGVHQDVPNRLSSQPRKTMEDYRDILQRMKGVSSLVDQVINLMNRGLELHIVQPKITMRDVPDQIKSLLTSDPKLSPLLEAINNFPQTFNIADKSRIAAEAMKIYTDSMAPSFQKLYDFILKRYIPNCRESIGLKDLPSGTDWYEYKIRHHTTTTMTPDQIFELGTSEVARIRDQMDSIRIALKFDGSLEKFFQFMREDKQFFFTDSASLINRYKEIAAKATAGLPKLFGKLPKLQFEVIPVPAYDQKSQTTAYYNAGSLKTGRPGYFYANTYDLSSRPKWEMEPLTLHESVPGHHLQISIAQELEGRPELLKNTDNTAFVEGWGLYAESLGNDLGFYQDPYTRMGQLTYEMWRSIRLVVDVGIHNRGWTRQQAIEYFRNNSGKSQHDIEVEVDRYIVDPGQALAYKIGELKIRDIRKWTERERGEDFNIRMFHDALLSSGALPLDLLERKMKIRVKVLQGKK